MDGTRRHVLKGDQQLSGVPAPKETVMPAQERRVAPSPVSRNPAVDGARALAILVVTVWHWTLSVTSRTTDGALVMPNPLHAVPGSWALTWLLQVVPIFFLVGGYVHLLTWQATRRRGARAAAFLRARALRLFVPAAVWAAVWLAVHALTALHGGATPWIWEWFPGLVTPLWFLAAYALLIAAVPLTARLHERYGARVLGLLAGLIALGSVADRAGASPLAAWVTGGLVLVFAHQLGYSWHSYDLGLAPPRIKLAVAGGGLAGLMLLTTVAGYPRSMVATTGDARSNMFPPAAPIAALAIFQLGLLLLATPPLARVLRRPAIRKPVLTVNHVALTIFLWHMTAYLIVVLIYEGLGGTLGAAPTTGWWAQRWLWLVAPATVLVLLAAVFGRFEAMSTRRPASRLLGRPIGRAIGGAADDPPT